MADDIEVYRLILEVEERGRVREMTDNLRAAENAMQALEVDFRAGKVAGDRYAQMMDGLANEVLAYRSQLGQTKVVADDFYESLGIKAERAGRSVAGLGRAAGESARGSRNGAFALLELSRAVEDAQYGIGGVLNNIPGLVMALGGGAGLTGIISIAAIAVAQLVKHWDDLLGLFGSGKVQTETEQMERLAKAAEAAAKGTGQFTAEERKRLEALQGNKDTRDRMDGDRKALNAEQDDDQKALGAGVRKAFVESGGTYDEQVEKLARREAERRNQAGQYRRADGTNDSEAMGRDQALLEKQVRDLADKAMHSNSTKEQTDAFKLLRSFGALGDGGFAASLDANDPREAKKRDDAGVARRKKEQDIDLAEEKSWEELERFGERREQTRRDARKYVDRFDGGALGAKADSGTLDVDAVRRAMRRTGASDADIKRLAGETTDTLNRRGTERAEQYAADHGMTVPAARARMARDRGRAEAARIGVDPLGNGDAHADLRDDATRQIANLIGLGIDPRAAYGAIAGRLSPIIGQAGVPSALAGTLPAAMAQAALGNNKKSTLVESAGVADAVQQAVGGGDDLQKKLLQAALEQNRWAAETARNTARRNAPTLLN